MQNAIQFKTAHNFVMCGVQCYIMVLSLACAPDALAQTQNEDVIHVPPIVPAALNRASQEIYSTPPTLPLVPNSVVAPSGNVWARTTEDGLHIWGKVDHGNQEIRWARQKSEILASDHIEVWLASVADLNMPTVGWGNQFGKKELAREGDCAGVADARRGDAESEKQNCERWYQEQSQYRQQFRRLFARQWLITLSNNTGRARSFEEFASRAYEELNANLFPENLPKVLKLDSDDLLKTEIGIDTTPETRNDASGRPHKYYRPIGYHFHTFIPYTAFPPAQQLRLSDVYVMVEVFAAAAAGQKQGAYSTTAPKQQWGKPETFDRIHLDSPRSYTVTPCEYDLKQKDLYDDTYSGWFIPTGSHDDDLYATFALINPEEGYLYEPGGVSPSIWLERYFWKSLEDGASICGPSLAWRKNGIIRRTDFIVDGRHLATKTLADGWTLLQSGPSTSTLSQFGSGQCGSCPVLNFAVYGISPAGEIAKALDLNTELTGPPDQPSGADMTIAENWSRIILYLGGAGDEEYGATGWKSLTYCLNGHAYTQCGEAKNVQPPNPPHYKELLGPEQP